MLCRCVSDVEEESKHVNQRILLLACMFVACAMIERHAIKKACDKVHGSFEALKA